MDKPFDGSVMTRFRKRLSVDVINEINHMIAEAAIKKDAEKASVNTSKDKPDEHDDNQNAPSGGASATDQGEQITLEKKYGKLIRDATCAPADIH